MNHDEPKIVSTKRENEELLHKSYSYHLHKKINDVKHWRFIDRTCKGYIYTSSNNNNITKFVSHTKCDKNYDKNGFSNGLVYPRSISSRETTTLKHERNLMPLNNPRAFFHILVFLFTN
ncbi:hypothetical protein DMUE_2820 [Dictyocoela muelleri]|nr:hypothetical protein DMUE_2820 [Dictyocoela muelleri]